MGLKRSGPVALRGSSLVVGNIGMYFAAYRLSLMGWNVMPTSRNARGIDLLAYNSTADHYLGIQVKALSRLKPPVRKSIVHGGLVDHRH